MEPFAGAGAAAAAAAFEAAAPAAVADAADAVDSDAAMVYGSADVAEASVAAAAVDWDEEVHQPRPWAAVADLAEGRPSAAATGRIYRLASTDVGAPAVEHAGHELVVRAALAEIAEVAVGCARATGWAAVEHRVQEAFAAVVHVLEICKGNKH